jgi:hypothetical protein
MKRLGQLHQTFAGGTVLAGFGGLAFRDAPVDLNVVLLTLLLLALRAKFWIDDDAYFEDVSTQRLPAGPSFWVGVGFAFASWIVWCFASLYVKDLEWAGFLMVWVFALSTAWIVATMVSKGAYKEQVPWLFLNILYAFGFFLVFARRQNWNPYRDRIVGFTTGVLVCMLFLFVADLAVTRILEAKRRPSA